VSADAPTPSAASPTPGAPRTPLSRPGGAGPAGTASRPDSGLVAQVAETAAASVRATRRLLCGRVPAYLGAGALLVAGVIDPPDLLAGGLAYEALRRWDRAPR
jgi:hypothetical protein